MAERDCGRIDVLGESGHCHWICHKLDGRKKSPASDIAYPRHSGGHLLKPCPETSAQPAWMGDEVAIDDLVQYRRPRGARHRAGIVGVRNHKARRRSELIDQPRRGKHGAKRSVPGSQALGEPVAP